MPKEYVPKPPLGPPTNLRPAGPHKDKTKKPRHKVKEELKKKDPEDL